MTTPPKAVYHQLVITASFPRTKIWLGDDDGHSVDSAVGELRTNLLPGAYVVEVELGSPCYPIRLEEARRYTQAELEAGPTCPRPMPRLDGLAH